MEKRRKIVVFGGAGRVGYNAAEKTAMLSEGYPLHIVLVDVPFTESKLIGLEQKLKETVAAARFNVKVSKATTEDTTLPSLMKNADVVVNAAGLPRGITIELDGKQVTLETREQLNKANAKITTQVAKTMGEHAPNALFLQVANQADTQTKVAYTVLMQFGSNKNKVISVNDLDKARLIVAVADELNIPQNQVDIQIAGTHDDHMTPLFSTLRVAKKHTQLTQVQKESITQKVRKGGWWMKQQMNLTSAEEPGAVVGSIVRSLINPKYASTTFNLGTMLNNELGSEVVMGLPSTISFAAGATLLPLDQLTPEEQQVLKSVAKHAQELFDAQQN